MSGKKGTTSGIVPCWPKLQAGGYPPVVVRSDGERALLAHVRAARAMTMLRVGRKFRRPVAPCGQKFWWMSAEKHVSRISAESRWQEGISLGILGGGVGAGDHAIGRPEQSRWCLRLMPGTLNCCWQSRDFPGIVGEPTLQREFVSRLQRCRQSTSCRHLWENLRGERGESTSDVMWKFASTV